MFIHIKIFGMILQDGQIHPTKTNMEHENHLFENGKSSPEPALWGSMLD